MGYRKITAVEKHSGVDGVKEIAEHMPRGHGDPCYYEILMTNDTAVRAFFPDIVHISAIINLDPVKNPGLIGMN